MNIHLARLKYKYEQSRRHKSSVKKLEKRIVTEIERCISSLIEEGSVSLMYENLSQQSIDMTVKKFSKNGYTMRYDERYNKIYISGWCQDEKH